MGRATATQLSAQGFHVIAGVRSEKDGIALSKAATTGRIVPVVLDVTSEPQIAAAAAQARELCGSSGLRAVINNAGIVVAGPVEHVSPAGWRRQFDVNFFGMIELTRAALPLLRLGVEFHGAGVPRLLFVSSIGGRVSQPLLTPYTTSKFATTALGDGMRLELRRQGIGVTVIEPGAVATAIWAKGDAAAEEFHPHHPARRLYDSEINGLAAAATRTAKKAISAEQAASAITRSLKARRAPARVLVGPDAKLIALLKHWLPVYWFDAILAREFGITRSAPLKYA